MTSVVSPLQKSPSLGRLQANLHDLITCAWERLHNRRGISLRLEAFHFVSDGRRDAKSSMLCVVLVKDLERNENTTLTLSLDANPYEGDYACLEN